jgi:hypothetical protein
MRLGTHVAAVTAAAGLFAIATPVAGASTAAPEPPNIPPPTITFSPTGLGPIGVDMAPIVIEGKTYYPGLHLRVPGFSLAPI